MIETPAKPSDYLDRLFIGGEWVKPDGSDKINVIMPSQEECWFSVPAASRHDVACAVAAARTAFDTGPWPRMSPQERAVFLHKIADQVVQRKDVLADLWSGQFGALHAVGLATFGSNTGEFSRTAALAETFPFEEQLKPSRGGEIALMVQEPVGVVAVIIPWNAPFLAIAAKCAPALLAGCTIVLKPSPEGPGDAFIFAEMADAVGIPPGVINIVPADREVSETLVSNPSVDKVTFTGSTAAGEKIGSLCASRSARCTLEMGGKSPALILDDFDLAVAARTIAKSAPSMAGQVCSSLTRLIVSDKRHDDFVDALAAEFSKIRVGDPFNTASQMGPLATERQRDRVESYIAKGIDEGARLATGGRRPPELDRGYYIQPTVFSGVENDMVIAREEIFGPVVCVLPAANLDKAVAMANDTPYGLNASVFTNDVEQAYAVSRSLQAGTVGHNSWRTDFTLSFGGFKRSGVGREGGIEGLRSFCELKTIILDEVPAHAATAV
ncbi:aldehyde dehydrogenase [Parasphingorhabdus sp.]|uniref:aldehyde dehydrogenase n=1 Tax=Parasphingorhabdus sp. TaxID=2709688 RepID=UPI003A93D9EB